MANYTTEEKELIGFTEQLLTPAFQRGCFACDGAGRIDGLVCGLCFGCGKYEPFGWLMGTEDAAFRKISEHSTPHKWHALRGNSALHCEAGTAVLYSLSQTSALVRSGPVDWLHPQYEMGLLSSAHVKDLCISCFPQRRANIIQTREEDDPSYAITRKEASFDTLRQELPRSEIKHVKRNKETSCYYCGRVISKGDAAITAFSHFMGIVKEFYAVLHPECYKEVRLLSGGAL